MARYGSAFGHLDIDFRQNLSKSALVNNLSFTASCRSCRPMASCDHVRGTSGLAPIAVQRAAVDPYRHLLRLRQPGQLPYHTVRSPTSARSVAYLARAAIPGPRDYSSGPNAGAGFLLRRASASNCCFGSGTLSALARLGLLLLPGDIGAPLPTRLPLIETGEQTSLIM
jgi:hypothetical protein